MAYIRPCNKCGQRISMREMRAGQWVAFDVSTEKPHKCGKKNKADPAIKNLAKQKIKEEDNDNIDLGYDSEIDKEIEALEERLENLKTKEDENYTNEKNKNEDIDIETISKYKEDNFNTDENPKKRGFEFYFWTFVIVMNLFALSRCVSD
jgi:hypothetical protein